MFACFPLNVWEIMCIFLMFIFERGRERLSVRRGEGSEREGRTQTLKQAPGSKLSTQSPMQGLNPQALRS